MTTVALSNRTRINVLFVVTTCVVSFALWWFAPAFAASIGTIVALLVAFGVTQAVMRRRHW